jgi:hypothetical protein
MGDDDFKAGREGQLIQPGMNKRDFDAGVAQRKADQEAAIAAFVGPKVEVPGVAYTLIIASPLLPFVYPVLGLVVNGTFIGVMVAASLVPGSKNWGMPLGFLLGIVSFFPGLWLEARASQVTLYRVARTSWRILGPVIVALLAQFDATGVRLQPNASGGALGSGLGIGLIVHFVCSMLDQLYFPVKSHVLKQREQVAKGIRPTRPLIKRLVYGGLWFIPIFILSNLVIMLGVRMFTSDRDVYEAFRASYSTIVYVVDGVLWYLLCLFGILPGTGKHAKMMVDPNLVHVD